MPKYDFNFCIEEADRSQAETILRLVKEICDQMGLKMAGGFVLSEETDDGDED